MRYGVTMQCVMSTFTTLGELPQATLLAALRIHHVPHVFLSWTATRR